ncbi:hypothetical protein K7W42_17800 [Deinococcus sp. HMF7604]|uniref:hypothetical protein n=1 Tax=Deinococcus betulae TaxID=2873312 RepID=UPI001CC94A6A|nr:hypothetical protein [Deinococcus betulae]MBZ9752700.1 hypothetical protein [Deinococcus betulae]
MNEEELTAIYNELARILRLRGLEAVVRQVEDTWYEAYVASRNGNAAEQTGEVGNALSTDIRRFRLHELMDATHRAVIQPIRFAQEALIGLQETDPQAGIQVLEIRDDFGALEGQLTENVVRMRLGRPQQGRNSNFVADDGADNTVDISSLIELADQLEQLLGQLRALDEQ